MNDQSSSSQPRTVGADPDNGLMQGLRQWIKNLAQAQWAIIPFAKRLRN